MNNLLSYCGLVDARISASEKDLPVQVTSISIYYIPEVSKVLGRLRDPFFGIALSMGVIFLGISPQHGKKIRPELQPC